MEKLDLKQFTLPLPVYLQEAQVEIRGRDGKVEGVAVFPSSDPSLGSRTEGWVNTSHQMSLASNVGQVFFQKMFGDTKTRIKIFKLSAELKVECRQDTPTQVNLQVFCLKEYSAKKWKYIGDFSVRSGADVHYQAVLSAIVERP